MTPGLSEWTDWLDKADQLLQIDAGKNLVKASREEAACAHTGIINHLKSAPNDLTYTQEANTTPSRISAVSSDCEELLQLRIEVAVLKQQLTDQNSKHREELKRYESIISDIGGDITLDEFKKFKAEGVSFEQYLKLKSEVDNVHNELKIIKHEADVAAAQTIAANESLSLLRAETAELERQLHELTNRNVETTRICSELNAELAERSSQIAQLQKENAELQRAHEIQLKESEKNYLRIIEESLHNLEATKVANEARIRELTIEYESKIVELKLTINELKEKTVPLESSRKWADLVFENKKLKSLLETKSQLINEAMEKLTQLEKAHHQIVENTVNKLTAAHSAENDKNAALIKRLNDEKSELLKKTVTLTQQLEEVNGRCAQLDAQIRKKTSECEKLRGYLKSNFKSLMCDLEKQE